MNQSVDLILKWEIVKKEVVLHMRYITSYVLIYLMCKTTSMIIISFLVS